MPETRPKPEPAKPSDLLDDRATFARRAAGRPPSAIKLLQHAERHGVDGIAETGAESGLSEEELTDLIAALDEINVGFRGDPKRKKLYQAPAKNSPAWRARRLLGLPEPEPLAKPSQKDVPPKGKVRATPKKGARGGAKRKSGARARRAR